MSDVYDFHYYMQGRSHNSLVVFLHGFMGDGNEFSPVISLLADQFYCLALDLPGHGQTQTQDDRAYSMESTARGIIRFLDESGISSCAIVGYSMGGRLALYLALHFPDYFSKVVLESASPGLKTQAERNQRIQKDLALAKRLETEEFSAFLSNWYRQPLFASLHAHPQFEQMLAHRLCNDPFKLATSLRYLGTGQQPSLWDKLRQISVPVLLIAGAFDQKFVDINTEMAACSPLITLNIADRCGHNIHFENTAWYAQTIQNFLS